MSTGSARLNTIKARADFLAAARGSKWITPRFILQMAKQSGSSPEYQEPRIGFTVTKKMGNAVKRNRIKRRLRHAAHAVAPQFAMNGHDYVIISREAALTCAFSDLLRDMEFAFSRIHANKKPSI